MKNKPEPTPLERALRLLAFRERTERELRTGLRKRQVPAADIDAALARLRELGYMNDAGVAQSRARTLVGRGLAPMLAARKLVGQGIDSAVAKEAATEAAGGKGEDELAAAALARRLRGRPVRDEKERQRLFRALVTRGFRPSAVARALRLQWEGDDGADDASDKSGNDGDG